MATFLSTLSLVLTVVLIFQTQGGHQLEKEIQLKQLAFAQAQQLEAARNKMLREMGTVAVKNEKMRELLLRHGYSVSYQPNAAAPASPEGAPPSGNENAAPKAAPAKASPAS